jgi:hypothetical protein
MSLLYIKLKKKLLQQEKLCHFSKKALKGVKSPKPSCLKAYYCGAAEYNGVPCVQVQMPDSSCCGPYTTPDKILIEITNTGIASAHIVSTRRSRT